MASMKFSQKSDVYSCGVLLLELLTGKDPLGVLPEDLDLPKWVRSMLQEKPITDMFDACYKNMIALGNKWFNCYNLQFAVLSRILVKGLQWLPWLIELKKSAELSKIQP